MLETDEVIEAPNRMPNGRHLILNAGGEFWRIPADGNGPCEKVDSGDIRSLNSDS